MRTHLSAIVILVGAAVARAEDATHATEGTALRVEVANALVRTLQNTKQVSFRLKWNYLPRTHVSQSFVFPTVTNDRKHASPKVVNEPPTSAVITLSNAALAS